MRPELGLALSLYLTAPTAMIMDIQQAVMPPRVILLLPAPLGDGYMTQDYMHADRYDDCP